MPTKFYVFFKRRGIGETLQILSTFENCETTLTHFIEQINKSDSYYNAYLRVRQDLVEAGLIQFKLNEGYEKMISLTDKGKWIIEKITEIEVLLIP